MNLRKLLLRIGSSACLLATTLPPWANAQAPAGDPFTTEPALATPAVAAAIERFFDSNGQAGSFEGKDGVRIAFRRVLQPDRSQERGAIVIVSGRTESMPKYKELVCDLSHAGTTS